MGQVSDQFYKSRKDILYTVQDNGMTVYLKNNGLSYQLLQIDGQKVKNNIKSRESLLNSSINDLPAIKINSYRIDVNWLNVNTNSKIEHGDTTVGNTNYYLQSCPDGALNVKSYKTITYKNIYTGIDLIYYNKNGHLKYDYVIKPYTDYNQIQFKINGAEKIEVNKKGELVICTPFGNIKEAMPLVIQNGKKLKASWTINNNIVSFKIVGINKNQPFIIDPLVRFWGTYYGGSGNSFQMSTATDNNNNVYLSGTTTSPSTTLIATIGSYQTFFAGNYDVFLAKFNSAGIRQWATYYGGAGGEGFGIGGKTIAIDKQNNIFMLAGTTSTTSIATLGSHQSSFYGGLQDAFLVKFNSLGIRQWGTYCGGNKNEVPEACTVDTTGNVFIVGYTNSDTATSMISAGAHQTMYGGGTIAGDAFIVKFNTAGIRQWGTYYGGISDDYGWGTTTDLNGNVYLCGISGSSPSIITTPGAYQTYIGPFMLSYLVKFNSFGTRIWGTYYGGVRGGGATNCATDLSNNVYLSGDTFDSLGDTIATLGACQQTFGGGLSDGFLTKFNSNGQRLWGTFYGGNSEDRAFSCAVDNNKNVYICGLTNSVCLDTIASLGSYQYTIGGGGSYDAFIAKFDSLGNRKWGTYYGGDQSETGNGCSISKQGHIYMAGTCYGTYTNNIISTPGSHQSNFVGTGDGFLVQFFDCGMSVDANVSSQSNGCFGVSGGSASLSVSGGGIYTYTWLPSGGNTNTVNNLTNGTYTCIVNSVCGNTSQTLTIIQPTSPLSAIANVSSTLVCAGNNASLSASATGGVPPYTYTWSSGAVGANIIETATITTNYSLTATDINGCSNTSVLTLSVDACVGIKNNYNNHSINVYPNPSNGMFYLTGNSAQNKLDIEVIDGMGQRILFFNCDNETDIIDLNEKVKGIYLLKIYQNALLITIKKLCLE